jgi:hypothetical protein
MDEGLEEGTDRYVTWSDIMGLVAGIVCAQWCA